MHTRIASTQTTSRLLCAVACLVLLGFSDPPASVVLNYDVAFDEIDKNAEDVLSSLVEIVNRRLNGIGEARAVDGERIAVELKGEFDDKELQRIDRQISRRGSIEFAILANRRDHAEIINEAEASGSHEIRRDGRVVATWRQVAVDGQGHPLEIGGLGEMVSRRAVDQNGKPVVAPDGEAIDEFLLVIEPRGTHVTGRNISRAYETVDTRGKPCVGIDFDQHGGVLLRDLTEANTPLANGFSRRLGIVLDQKLRTAPHIREAIGKNALIAAHFDEQEVADLVDILNSGELPCSIHKVE